MADPRTREVLRSLILSAGDLKTLTEWPDAIIEDYINITANLIALADLVDRQLEDIPTALLEGSVPFVGDDSTLTEDNLNFFWDKTNELLQLSEVKAKVASFGDTQLSTWDINGNYTNCPGIIFEEDPVTKADTARTLRWNEQDRCLEYLSPLGNTIQIGQEVWGIGVNKTGGAVTDGQVVYASGIQGSRLTFNFADAREAAKCSFVGVVTTPINNNEEGAVTEFGLVHDTDTSAWIEGTKLFIAADATGMLTDIPPTNPDFRVWVATVLYQHPTQGKMFVAPKIDYTNGITFNSLDVNNLFTAGLAYFGNVSAGNYSEFEADGTYIAKGDATTFDDLQGSILSLKTVGIRVTVNDLENTLEYTALASLSDYAFDNYQVRHRWLIGSVVKPHIHWEQNQDAIPNFLIQYRWQVQGEAKTVGWTNYPLTGLAFTYVSGTLNQISGGAGITPPVGAGLSDVIELRIIRDNANASGVFAGADPYTGVVSLTFADIHIEEDTLGSRLEFVK